MQDTGDATKVILDAGGTTFGVLSRELSNILDRHVIDTTQITWAFNLHLEFARDEATRRPPGGAPPMSPPANDPAAGPSIFTAVQQQLGLKLEPIRGPAEFLVIDEIEKPSQN
jgi:uncharacterized protein (TIGR03435 family)